MLAVRAAELIDFDYHLERFRALCRNSRQYQGHGWGCCWLDGGQWHLYRNLRPIWEDDFRPPDPVRLLLVHARSAFRDQDIAEENNQPFVAGAHAFVFNGELHGVRLRAPGRIGAEKIFHFVRRFAGDGSPAGVNRACRIIRRRSTFVRAVLAAIDDRMLERIAGLGDYFRHGLEGIIAHWEGRIRGKGLMIGMDVGTERNAVLRALQRRRVLAIPAGDTVVRFLQPYIIERRHIDEAVRALADSLGGRT